MAVTRQMAMQELARREIARRQQSNPADQILQSIPQNTLDQKINNKMQIDFEPSFLEKLAPNILAGSAEMGQSLLNSPSNIAKFLASKGVGNEQFANKIPRSDYDFNEMLKLPGSKSDQLIQSITKNIPSMLMPEMKLGAVSKALETIPGFGKVLSNAAGRIAPQAAWGELTSENPYEGAKEFGLAQAAIEAATLPFKGIEAISQLMNPAKYAKNQMQKIKVGHDVAKSQMEEAYNPVMDQYGSYLTSVTPKSYLGLSETQIKRFTPEVKKSYQEYLNDPNFQKLHDLQSQMGKDYARLAGNTNKINQAQNLKISRNYVNSKIAGFLGQDEKAMQQYNSGRQIGRDLYYPYLSNVTLKKISEGVKRDIKPTELYKALTKSKEKIVYKKNGEPVTAIPEGHPLSNILDEVNAKINKGKAYQYAIPTITASLGGGHFLPGIGHVAGGTAGALFSHYMQPSMINFVQNPQVENFLKKYIKTPAQGITRQAIGYNMYDK